MLHLSSKYVHLQWNKMKTVIYKKHITITRNFHCYPIRDFIWQQQSFPYPVKLKNKGNKTIYKLSNKLIKYFSLNRYIHSSVLFTFFPTKPLLKEPWVVNIVLINYVFRFSPLKRCNIMNQGKINIVKT